MKTILLAAGRSTRLAPLEDKNFLPLVGKPLIEHQVDRLKKAGFDDLVIVGGAHNLEKLKAHFSDIEIVEQKNLDEGMAGAILSCKEQIAQNPFIVVSTNDILDMTAYELMKQAIESDAQAGYLLGYKVHEYFPGGYLEVNEQKRITRIVEKPGEGNEPSDLVNLVIHYHPDAKAFIGALETTTSKKDDRYEVALQHCFDADCHYHVVAYEGFWQAIKYPWHINAAWQYFFNEMPKNIAENAEVAETAVISGNVIIEEGAKVFANACIKGPAYIGKNAIVANNALVRDSHIGEKCVVGFATEVARSYLAESVWTHSNYIGDSLIDTNVSFGAGAVTANLRLDEKEVPVTIKGEKVGTKSNKCGAIIGPDVRVGINTSIMPGIKIGKNSAIGSGIVIEQDIDENSFVTGDWTLKTKPNKLDIKNITRD